MKKLIKFFKKLSQKFSTDEATQLAAALAYYTVFSLAPLLVLLIILLGFILKSNEVQTQIIDFLQTSMGSESTETIKSMMQAAAQPSQSWFAKILSPIFLILGANGVVTQLQYSFNKVWPPKKTKSGIKEYIKTQLLAFLIIGIVGVIIFASLLLSTGLSMTSNYVGDIFPAVSYLLPLSEFIISFGLTSLLFMILFRYLPTSPPEWSQVWKGGILTGFLFFVGKFGLTLYFSMGNVASGFGAAGSLLILLLWIYYSSLILLLGAEFTSVLKSKKT